MHTLYNIEWDRKITECGRGVKLTTHLHLVPRSRMCGILPPFPQYVLMAWCLVKHRDNFTLSWCMSCTCNVTSHDLSYTCYVSSHDVCLARVMLRLMIYVIHVMLRLMMHVWHVMNVSVTD